MTSSLERALPCLGGGEHWVKAELVKVEDCSDFAERRRRLFGVRAESPVAAPALRTLDLIADDAGKDRTNDSSQEQIRTLWVDFDEHGERFKRWRDVCKESYAPTLEDKPIDGSFDCLAFHQTCRASRRGCSPVVAALVPKQTHRSH